MKLEKEVRDNIEMLKGIDDESAGYVAAAIGRQANARIGIDPAICCAGNSSCEIDSIG